MFESPPPPPSYSAEAGLYPPLADARFLQHKHKSECFELLYVVMAVTCMYESKQIKQKLDPKLFFLSVRKKIILNVNLIFFRYLQYYS